MATELSEESLLSGYLDQFIFDNFEGATEQLNSIIKKFENSPNKYEYILYKGVCLYKLGKYEEALKELDNLEKESNYKKDYTFFLTKGKILFYLCKYDESIKALNEGKNIDKEHSNLFDTWIKKAEEEKKD